MNSNPQRRPYRPALIALGAATVLLILYALFRGKKAVPGEGAPTGTNPGFLGPIVKPKMVIRNDARGLGHYGAPRDGGTRKHAGLDIRCYENQPVLAPFAGKVTRTFSVYPLNTTWTGVELIGDDGITKLKVLYCRVVSGLVGGRVVSGQQIGVAQAISQKWGRDMLDHLHVELYRSGNRVDPAGWFALG